MKGKMYIFSKKIRGELLAVDYIDVFDNKRACLLANAWTGDIALALLLQLVISKGLGIPITFDLMYRAQNE